MSEDIVPSPKLLQIKMDIQNPFWKRIFALTKLPIENLLALNRLNQLYDRIDSPKGHRRFFESILEALDISYSVSQQDLSKIPRQGPTIVVSNHPFGAIDGIILSAIFLKIRPDVKVMANYLLGMIPETRDLFVAVDPFGKKEAIRTNARALRCAIRFLSEGGLLSVFPAGEVSHFHWKEKTIRDPEWNPLLAALVKKTGAAVIPVFFKGRNSAIFQIAGLVHPFLRTALLPREMLKKSHQNITVRIGNLIHYPKLAKMQSDSEIIKFLRVRTYILSSIDPHKGSFRPMVKRLHRGNRFQPIISPVNKDRLYQEVAALPPEQGLIDADPFFVLHAKAEQIPLLLKEIGRLREITFRAEGEGSGKKMDIDCYDSHYRHLFLWNESEREIAGAYRFGLTDEIISIFGQGGLYTHTLFEYGSPFLSRINPAMELGRSFVQQKYQKTFQALMLLWKGIAGFITIHPRYRYLFGPVSISKEYQSVSRQLIVTYLKHAHPVSELEKYVKPRNPYRKTGAGHRELRSSLDLLRNINWLSDLVAELEADRKGVPILIKQYLKLGGRILGFNLDPDFSNVLDVLMMVDLVQTDHKILDRYFGAEASSDFKRYHNDLPLAQNA